MRVLTRRLAVLWLAAPLLWAGPVAAQVFHPETATLDNGMQVVVVPNHRVPVVTHMVWYRIGSADEPAGKTGIAHLLEHLMFKGTPAIPPGQFSKIVAAHGGNDNAFTGSDYTAYFQNVAKENLELVMRMESDRMANLRLDPKDVLTEREVVLEERRSRTDNDPAALLNERAEAILYLNHPYRNPVIGWAAEIAKLTPEDALEVYAKYYAPNNAILIVGGDVTLAEVMPLAKKYYGPIPRKETPVRLRPQEPPALTARRVELRHPDVHQPAWSRRYLAPSYNTGDSKYASALEVLAETIGGSSTSRLYRDLAIDKGVATSAGAYYEPTVLDLSTFGVYASPRPGVSPAVVEQAMDAVLADIVGGSVDPAEIERAKERLIANVAYSRDSLQAGAYAFGMALTTGGSIAQVEDWPQRIAAVTVDEVREAAKRVLQPEQSVTALLLPAAAANTDAPQPDISGGTVAPPEAAAAPAGGRVVQ